MTGVCAATTFLLTSIAYISCAHTVNLLRTPISRDQGEGKDAPALHCYHGNKKKDHTRAICLLEKKKRKVRETKKMSDLNIHVFFTAVRI